jgi:myo-inositol 2-dehydrogenase / D-chiro-inositol 1-dehydrogenase
MQLESTAATRRDFLGTSVRIAAGASLAGTLVFPKTVHAGVSESLRIGLIGAGLRGTGAAQNALSASPENVLVAVGDAFPEAAKSSVRKLRRVAGIKNQVQVADDHLFSGFDAYKQVVDSGVDVVILTEPPHFRPHHLAYAVAAGKHCFVEKPIAVDAPGVQSVLETCHVAEAKNLAIVSGLCWRYHPAVQETVRRIVEDGAIGEIVAIRSCFNTGELWEKPDQSKWSRMEFQIRNWLYYKWLSGDHITEQAIHSIDKTAWVQGDAHALTAFGTGGRQKRTAARFGDIFDHHSVFYEYPNGVQVSLMCRQQNGCSNYVEDVVLGTKGRAELTANRIEGENPWKYEGPKADMYDLEHVALFRSIRDGKPINNGKYMCNSTMLAIMGRMCTYTGQTLSWDDCIHSPERLGPTKYAWTDDVPAVEVPIPGVTKAVLAKT